VKILRPFRAFEFLVPWFTGLYPVLIYYALSGLLDYWFLGSQGLTFCLLEITKG